MVQPRASHRTWHRAFPAKTAQPPILNEKDLFAYKQKGRGTLTGQAFLVSPSGKAITQPGAPVHLIPITPYTRYWFDHNVRTTSCSPTEPATSAETSATPHTPTDCPQEALTQAPGRKTAGFPISAQPEPTLPDISGSPKSLPAATTSSA